MGLELDRCSASIKHESYRGRLHLDSNALEFRAGEFKWTVATGKGTRASAKDGVLKVSRGSKTALFEVGAKASKWAEKICNPPSRATKLGIKAGQVFWLSGDFGQPFTQELKNHGLDAARSPSACHIAFLLLESQQQLKSFDRVAKACSPGTHIWAVWPKGVEVIKQSQVMERAKKYGMGPGKSMAFDALLTAMRFTLPKQ